MSSYYMNLEEKKEHDRQAHLMFGFGLASVSFMSILSIGYYILTSEIRQRKQERHLDIPKELRVYDINTNGILEASEISRLPKDITVKVLK